MEHESKPDVDALLAGFPRVLPVFPLPDVVLFPGAVLPLHIFEARYRRMLADVLEGDGLLGLALLQSCSPEEYEARPPFHATVCVGHVVHHEPLAEGRSNIALLGLSAASADPVEGDTPYLQARLDLLADTHDAGGVDDARLTLAFDRVSPGPARIEDLCDHLARFFPEDRVVAALVSTLALTAPILAIHKLALLEERSIEARLERLLAFLDRPWQWN